MLTFRLFTDVYSCVIGLPCPASTRAIYEGQKLAYAYLCNDGFECKYNDYIQSTNIWLKHFILNHII